MYIPCSICCCRATRCQSHWLSRQGSIRVVVRTRGICELSRELAIAIIVEAEADLTGATCVAGAHLGCCTAQSTASVAGRDVARLATLVPFQTILAVVHYFEHASITGGVGNARCQRCQVGLACVHSREHVILCITQLVHAHTSRRI